MKKRVFSLFLALVVTFSMVCPLVFADDSSTHVHNWTSGVISEFSDTVEGIPVSVSVKKCTECNLYKHTYKFFGLSFDFYSVTAYTGIVEDFLLDVSLHIMNSLGKNASAKKYEIGGGSAGTGGVGRHPSGYQDSTGTPSINLDGVYIFALSHDYTYARINAASKTSSSTEDSKYSFPVYRYCADSTLKSTFDQGTITESGDSVKYSVKFDEYKYSGYFGERFKGVAPCDGQYSLYIRPKYSISGSVFSSSYNDSVFRSSSGDLGLYGLDSYYVAGSTISIYSNVSLNYIGGYYPKSVTYQFTGVPYLKCKPTAPLYSKKTNITINNNTWNGNIYQDNSTNLTYIYPQYTTINENNETVTNISNNPIIYNNETKQYYTYDTVTNNYYYITYETPTPSPSPDPGTDPTPTPEPGEDTGDTSGIMKILQEIKAVLVSGFAGITEKLQNIGVGGSTPETAKPGSSSGGQSWWDKLLSKVGDAIMDGLLGAISAVLKLIFKLFTTILGWIIWLVSQVLTLFPFLPPGLGALLIGGVVVCFIIGLIKFIRGVTICVIHFCCSCQASGRSVCITLPRRCCCSACFSARPARPTPRKLQILLPARPTVPIQMTI